MQVLDFRFKPVEVHLKDIIRGYWAFFCGILVKLLPSCHRLEIVQEKEYGSRRTESARSRLEVRIRSKATGNCSGNL